MRLILLTFFFFLALGYAFSQANKNPAEHLSFKGVPIDGTLNEFLSNMKRSGFTLLRIEDGIAMLQGDFAGYKNCLIGVSTLKQKDLVGSIAVVFPEQETWSFLSSDYFTLKELLTIKYGEPSESVEKFDSGLQFMDDNNKMDEVGMDRCKYYTTFQTAKGSIQLSIEHDSFTCFVKLGYYDKFNSDIIRAKALDDL